MSKPIQALALCLVVAGASLHAQPKSPAFLDNPPPNPRLETPHLQAEPEGPVRVGEDGRAAVTVLVTPRPKMHVYAADATGYVPFSMKVQPQAGVTPGKVSYPAAETYVFPPTGESSRVYIEPFRVTQVVAVTPALREQIATGSPAPMVVTIRYQACDDAVCYRPTTGSLAFTIAK
jgi:hypothetical protein